MKRARVEDGAAAPTAKKFELAEACAQFDAIWGSVPVRYRGRFRDHAYMNIVESSGGGVTTAAEDSDEEEAPATDALQAISEHLRPLLPVSGLSPEEPCTFPPVVEGSDEPSEVNSIFVDSFLYDEDALDEICSPQDEDEQGAPPRETVSRCYCPDVNFPKVCLPMNFLSHSLSISELRFLYSDRCLGELAGRTVCDVGSRLGCVLYAGYHLSKAKSLVGVEINSFFAKLQRETIAKFEMADRLKVVDADVCSAAGREQVAAADYVVLHNVFEFFADKDAVRKCWDCIRETASRRGQRLVVVPGLDETWPQLFGNEDWKKWLVEIPVGYPSEDEWENADDLKQIHMYAVR